MKNEIWKDIEGYKGYYQASDMGRVRSVGRTITRPDTHGGIMDCYLQGRVLKATLCGNNGFLKVILSKDGIHDQQLVHRLIANTFIPKIDGLPDVDHKDFNKLNNCVENLEWTEDHINNKKLFDSGHSGGTFKSVGQVRHIETGAIYKSCMDVAKTLNLPYASINYHVHGQMGMTHVRGNHFELT